MKLTSQLNKFLMSNPNPKT